MDTKDTDAMLNTIQDLNLARRRLEQVLPDTELSVLERCVDGCKERVIYNTLAQELGFDKRPLLD